MDCKFSNLQFGDEVVIRATGNANCYQCGAEVKEQLDSKSAQYQGHLGKLDLFLITDPDKCPSCGVWLNGYAEVCEYAGGLLVSS